MLKKIILAVAGIALSTPVLADRGWGRHYDDDSRGHRHYKHHHKHHRHHPRPVFVVPPPPVYYVPAPVYHYAPPPRVYYAPPPPVYYSPQPQHSGISIRLHFPL